MPDAETPGRRDARVSPLTGEPIDTAALVGSVGDPAYGGTVLFVGSVRRSEEDGPVNAIEYSAYEAMAEAEIGRILTEAEARWPGVRLGVRHRIGRVPVGEASVAVAAAMPHRAEAFDAARYVIEEIKRRLPVWKQEHFEDGNRRWRSNAEERVRG